MADINVYFENQQKLHGKIKEKNVKTSSIVNKKIENDENNSNLESISINETVEDVKKRQCSDSEGEDFTSETDGSEDEYVPSEECSPSEEETIVDFSLPSTSKGKSAKKSKIRKYYDDGDFDRFNARIKEWKAKKKQSSKLKASSSGVIDNENDIKESLHEIDGGLKVPAEIWKKLFRYQKTGVKWLWELHQIESGGLLGDEMGLGKTVQVIAFLSGLNATGGGVWGGLGPSLIVAPATVLHQWVAHFHHWWPPVRVAVLHNSGTFNGTPDRLIRDINVAHGILITTYSGIVQHRSSIECRKWHYMILDEGHKIRNFDTQVSKAVRKIKTPHRIVVTGSPMQNNLQELWSIFDFMSPGLLGTLPAFVDHFATPITQGGYTNATRLQETTALSLATTLKNIITPYMLRRTKDQVKDHLKLPDKKEQVLFCSLSNEQKDVYKSFLLSTTVRSILDKESYFGDPFRARILIALSTLRKICNHPDLYIHEIDDEENHDASQHSESFFGNWKRSGKMVVINSLLKIWKKQNHRVLIFTQSRAMICILELFLQQNNYKYLKMDGTTNIGSRQPLVSMFNSDDSYLVFLATTRVGGLGVNLTGADRVIIYDPDWNPAVDTQAKERAWRIGQNRDVTIYRLLSAGTVEEKIYQRQIFKQLLGNKVLIDPNQKNYLKTSTLQGLFSLDEPEKDGVTETANIFKHTQVEVDKPSDQPKMQLLSGGVSFSKTKMEEMRKLAQQISKKLSSNRSDDKKIQEEEDPRERYKKKLLPPPPPPEVPQVNKIDDRETEMDFSTVLSEIEIVSMYSKPEPLDFLNINSEQIDDTNAESENQIESEKNNRSEEVGSKNNITPIINKEAENKIGSCNRIPKNNHLEEDCSENNITPIINKKTENKIGSFKRIPKNNSLEEDCSENNITPIINKTAQNKVGSFKRIPKYNHLDRDCSENNITPIINKESEHKVGSFKRIPKKIKSKDSPKQDIALPVKNKKSHKRKRNKEKILKKLCDEDGLDEDKDFLHSVERVKSKKIKVEDEPQEDSDQYVLKKLFSKGVQSALHHDKVVGLAEREERHRIQTEAQHRAMMALKALRKSRLKNWRW